MLGGRLVVNARVTGYETHQSRLSRVVGRRVREGGTVGGGAAGSIATPFSKSVPEAPAAEEPFAVGCDVAVLAAGAWSSQDVAWPAPPLGVRPVKGQLVRLHGRDLLRHVVRAPQVYLVPREGGDLVVGATMEEQGFDPTPTAGAVMDLLWNARLIVPAIYDLQLAEVDVGFRPATRDHLPVIGATDVRGLYVATGHFRHGVLLAPVTAGLLADLIVEGRLEQSLAPFRPQRLAEVNPLAHALHG
jgi:glycine oxidase